MYKIFIDGKEGTTGLRLYERLKNRHNLQIMTLSEQLRKDPIARAKMINDSDLTFLCLPEDASKEAINLINNETVKIIDTSTAFRTDDFWVYGFPELGEDYLEKIKNAKRVSVPGCHASGVIALLYPLMKEGLLKEDLGLSIFSLTGYSGGGKKMITQYQNDDDNELKSPRIYGLSQNHKHLKEIVKHCSLKRTPLFTPVVNPYYSGMLVSIGFMTSDLKNYCLDDIYRVYQKFYQNQPFIRLQNQNLEMVGSNNLSGKDYMEIFVFGNDERLTVMARFDNLGKGASGAAIECMNLMLGFAAEEGLDL